MGRKAASSIMFGLQLLAVMLVVLWGGWQQWNYVWNTAVSSDGGGGVGRIAASIIIFGIQLLAVMVVVV